jgi:hypothetical protein
MSNSSPESPPFPVVFELPPRNQANSEKFINFLRELARYGLQDCSVLECVCDEGDKGPVATLPTCRHRYHLHYIRQWIESPSRGHNRCPVCRTVMYDDGLPLAENEVAWLEDRARRDDRASELPPRAAPRPLRVNTGANVDLDLARPSNFREGASSQPPLPAGNRTRHFTHHAPLSGFHNPLPRHPAYYGIPYSLAPLGFGPVFSYPVGPPLPITSAMRDLTLTNGANPGAYIGGLARLQQQSQRLQAPRPQFQYPQALQQHQFQIRAPQQQQQAPQQPQRPRPTGVTSSQMPLLSSGRGSSGFAFMPPPLPKDVLSCGRPLP